MRDAGSQNEQLARLDSMSLIRRPNQKRPRPDVNGDLTLDEVVGNESTGFEMKRDECEVVLSSDRNLTMPVDGSVRFLEEPLKAVLEVDESLGGREALSRMFAQTIGFVEDHLAPP